jgi:acetyltransferase-like isoleucine patch superfamily enzyme
MEMLFINPFTLWLRWFCNTASYKIKYAGKRLRIGYMADIKKTVFGRNNTVNKHARLRNATVGDFTYVAKNTELNNVRLGKFCSIGPYILCGLGAHPSRTFVSTHPVFYSTLGQGGEVWVQKDLFDEYPVTTIGNDVWIGANTVIRDGVTIGNGAIIAAGSVVTGDVEPYAVMGGVPAKLIRKRFTEEEILFLEEFKWWDKDPGWIKENRQYFLDIQQLVRKFKS